MMERMKKQLGPLLMSVLFLVLGVLVLWAARYWINDPNSAMGDAVFVSLLVLPILIYAIISGSITELKGPGGVGATFNALATTSVNQSVDHDLVSVEEDSQILTKGGIDSLNQQLGDLDENSPILMTITFRGGHYALEALNKYVQALSNSRNFKFVVFLDQDERFLAYIPSWAFKNLLNTPGMGEELVRVINEGDLRTLLSYPGMVQTTITTSSTNAEALRQMADKNIDALIVTNKNNRLVGVAERDLVLTKLMLALIK
jgi:CBS domain-containing protein